MLNSVGSGSVGSCCWLSVGRLSVGKGRRRRSVSCTSSSASARRASSAFSASRSVQRGVVVGSRYGCASVGASRTALSVTASASRASARASVVRRQVQYGNLQRTAFDNTAGARVERRRQARVGQYGRVVRAASARGAYVRRAGGGRGRRRRCRRSASGRYGTVYGRVDVDVGCCWLLVDRLAVGFVGWLTVGW